MDSFKDYDFATINSEENTLISQLEQKIQNDIGKEVVLIAYEKKD